MANSTSVGQGRAWQRPASGDVVAERSDQETGDAAEDAVIERRAHAVRRYEHQDGQGRDDGEAGQETSRHRTQEAEGSEQDVGRELDAEAPAWKIPGLAIMQVKRLKQQQVGGDRSGDVVALGAEGWRGEGVSRLRRDNEFHEFIDDQDGQGRRLDRPDPAEASDDVLRKCRRMTQSLRVGLRDDEPAENEEHVDEKSQRFEPAHAECVSCYAKVADRDADRAGSAPAVHRPKRQEHGCRCLRATLWRGLSVSDDNAGNVSLRMHCRRPEATASSCRGCAGRSQATNYQCNKGRGRRVAP